MIRVIVFMAMCFQTHGFYNSARQSMVRKCRYVVSKNSVGALSKIIDFLTGNDQMFDPPCVMGEESIMSPKAHGTSEKPVQPNLRWGCDQATADRICNFNRHYAEYRGYWLNTEFMDSAKAEYETAGKINFYDSVTGKPLFVAPVGRSLEDFLRESKAHGWPSFRDEEVVWENVRCLKNGEAVGVDGTHLGHNLPDYAGNRYCINLVSVAGRPNDEM